MPTPVCDLKYWDSNNFFSALEFFDLSVFEKNHTPTNVTTIENKAGYLYGKIASLLPKISTHTTGPSITKSIAINNPAEPPITAPLVVRFFQ